MIVKRLRVRGREDTRTSRQQNLYSHFSSTLCNLPFFLVLKGQCLDLLPWTVEHSPAVFQLKTMGGNKNFLANIRLGGHILKNLHGCNIPCIRNLLGSHILFILEGIGLPNWQRRSCTGDSCCNSEMCRNSLLFGAWLQLWD